jgi:hypothetical protein
MVVCAAWLAVGCATPSSGEKGGVVTANVRREELRAAFAGRRFALLIGVPGSTIDEHWRPLRFATKDVNDLAVTLQDPLRGKFTRVEVLTTPETTTRDQLRAAVARLAALATQPEDVVLIYVSAHGTLARDARGELERFLVTSDADFHRVSDTGLPIDALANGLSASVSRRRVVVLATCHSGSGKSLLPDDVVAELATRKGTPRLEDVSRASIVLSASDFLETAREDETLENDVYTHWLVEALNGPGDRNGDGAVTATEAHDYARRRTWAFSQGRQRPTAAMVEVGADPVVLSGEAQREGRPELYSYVSRFDGFSLKVDGEERAELPGGAAVSAGSHRVELTKGSEVLLSEDVLLREGERLDVSTLARKQDPFLAVSAIGGAFGFVDQVSRNELLPIAPAVGVAVRFERVLLDRLSVDLDLSGFAGQGTLTLAPQSPGVPFGWSAFSGGAAVTWQWDWRWVSMWVGPRVAALWVQRSFAVDALNGTQSVFTVTPGLLLGGAIHFTPRWELSLGLQGSLVLMVVDGNTRTLGFAGGWAGLGYRF